MGIKLIESTFMMVGLPATFGIMVSSLLVGRYFLTILNL